MLIELPTADEIDALAITTPRFEVRKFEFDLGDQPADLKYSPCKGQMVLVIAGKNGIALTRINKKARWNLPSGRISTIEEATAAAKRIALEQCGVMIRCLDLAAMYDVIWHYSDITIKRLHLVYSALTDDEGCGAQAGSGDAEAMFFDELPEELMDDDLAASAVTDCSNK
ncbi:MAG: hypothetical protein A3K60_06675 [Euryarchaeota archaeon RBG_19FT_COMBO_56_21]|nr:MAG: hypothetical protein A3K60_06675 [Euryarchaeota archaeon RBG_19FT_COMBO_56_21]